MRINIFIAAGVAEQATNCDFFMRKIEAMRVKNSVKKLIFTAGKYKVRYIT
jgi:hypothetical protein